MSQKDGQYYHGLKDRENELSTNRHVLQKKYKTVCLK